MKKKILNNITSYNKFLSVFKIIASCYKDQNRLDEINFLEKKLIEITMDDKKYQEGYQYSDYKWLYNKIENDCYTFMEVYQNVEDYVDNRCRMASVMTLNNLSDRELKLFGDNVLEYINKYKDIDEASKICYLESQFELNSFITLLLDYYGLVHDKSISKHAAIEFIIDNRYKVKDDMTIWVDVFNQIKVLMRNLTNCSDGGYKVINEKYFELLKYYFIIVTSPTFTS